MANADTLKTEDTSNGTTEVEKKTDGLKVEDVTNDEIVKNNEVLTKTEENIIADVKEETEQKPLTPETEARIVRQLEYYFGDINLPRDKFLLEQIQLDDGWVPLSVLLTFKRLASLCSDGDVIVQVMLKSGGDIVEVSDDRKKLRRNPEKPIPEYNDERRKELMSRTAYVKGFPADEKLETIMKYFETHGPFESLTMRHYLDKATKKNIFKGSIFIIFNDIETCKKFIDLEEVKFNETVLMRKWQADYLEGKKQERLENSKKRGKGKKEREEPKKTHTFPKGAIVFMEGFKKEDTTRENIKAKVNDITGSQPAYVTYDKGDKQGYIRFSEENGAIEFSKKLTDNKVDISGNEITIRVLEGEEEDKFLNDVFETIGKIRSQNRNSGRGKGKKRRGFGDSGPRAKQEKK